MTMKFYSPMLAEPITKALKRGVISDWTRYALEQKFDGIRLTVYGRDEGGVEAVTRPRDGGTRFISQRDRMSPRLLRELGKLPSGYVLDGEQVNGDVSTDVKRRDILDRQAFIVFDLIDLDVHSTRSFTYDERRGALEELFRRLKFDPALVRLAPSVNVTSEKHFKTLRNAIWKSGGEGVMLKLRTSVYHAGKRTFDWIKVKKVFHDALPVIGFKATKGTVMNRGPFAIVQLRGDHADPKTWPTVKTLDDEQLKRFNDQWAHVLKLTHGKPSTTRGEYGEHPAMGRMLVIEHFGRTRDGGYRGPVLWDRWEDE